VILSTKVISQNTDTGGSKVKSRKQIAFDLICIRLDLTEAVALNPADVVATPIAPSWKVRGQDLPIFSTYDPHSDLFIFAAASPYEQYDKPSLVPPDPTPDEIAPIPRAGESLDVPTPEKPPPYSWSQTGDSVTVAFALPSSTPKSSIKMVLGPKHLTLNIGQSSHEGARPFLIPNYTAKPFWDGIDTSASFWTWDREGETSKARVGQAHTVGLLTLHLEKAHEGTRWPHVFATVGTGSTLEEDEEVPETVDPSELWLIRESLEKYTASLVTGEDASGLGLGKGLPSLAEGEIDEEVDAQVGSLVVLTQVSRSHGAVVGDPKSTGMPVEVLSQPIRVNSASGPSPASLVVKNGIDGLLFDHTPSSETPWTHTATFSALAFVLASKRDTRFVVHYGPSAVLAFESGAAASSGGANLYVYRGTVPSSKSAKQAVLKVSDGQSGVVLGVGARVDQTGLILVCLCERSLSVLRGVV
jgi:hypothetical protein